MVEIWFALLVFTLTMFVVMDGWNFGSGALHFVVAKTPAERRQVVEALGPLWSWHEVWLIAAGGTFLMAFPRIMAVSFAGFYLALWLVLWSFVLRGIALEVGGHIEDRLWQSWWDFVFCAASVTLAILFGTALGNVIRGVPLGASGSFSMALFTTFRTTGPVGILDWYTISVAILATLILCAHGATYLRLKTEGAVHARSERSARILWSIVLVLLPVVSVETLIVRPDLRGAMLQQPVAWLGIAGVATGAWALVTGLRGRDETRAFAGSCAVIAGLLVGAAAGVFPVFLRSTLDPQYSLTAHGGATSSTGLAMALVWWPVALVLAFTYLAIVTRRYRGKVAASQAAALLVTLAQMDTSGAAAQAFQQGTPALSLDVTTKARAMRQGEVVLAIVRPSRAVTSVEVTAFDAPLHAWPSTHGLDWVALIGVPLTTRPARYEAEVRATAADGNAATARVNLPIERGQFASRRLTVDPQFVNPPAASIERITAEAKAMADLFAHPTPDRLWRGAFHPPVPGASTSSFGRLSILNGESRTRHQGADFRAAEGTPVHAPNGGRVVVAADYYFSGNTVILDHGAGLFSLFAHFSKIDVAPGAVVKTGDLLGEAGATGRVTGPHVHWAVRLNGASVDPLSLVQAVESIPE